MSNRIQIMKSNPKLKHDGYFMLRRPLLSLDTLDRVLKRYRQMDRGNAAAIVQELLENEQISSSVRLASPGLHDRLINETTPEKSPSQLAALMRYVVRMSTRSTPFGAFASVGLGKIDNQAQYVVGEDIECRLEIDCAVLLSIDEKLRKKFPIREDMRVRKTSILYPMNGYVRFIERKFKNGHYSFELARISQNQYLDRVLDRISKPAVVGDLLSDLMEFDDEISPDVALEYISGLVESGLLELDFGMRTIGKAPLDAYLRDIGSAVPDSDSDIDISMLRTLSSIIRSDEPCTLAAAASRVDAAEACLKAHGFDVASGKSVHVDAFANDEAVSVPPRVLAELETTLTKLRQLFPHVRPKSLTEFMEAFERRFSDSFVPVMAALDPETGIAFGYSTASVPWTSSLGMIGKRQVAQRTPESVLSETLLANLIVGKRVINLSDIELNQGMPVAGLPEDFSVNITLFDDGTDAASGVASGAPVLMLNAVNAEGSTNLMTRFAARHDGLANAMKRSTDIESEQRQGATILAEIVHIPAPRAANVLPRPALREFEIVLSGMGSVDDDHQIRVDDLFIGIVNNEIILWSEKLNKRVVPYLSSAHNFVGQRNLAIYQFFCLIATQSSSAPNFNWPKSLLAFPFLPRVQCGSVLLARARWNIARQEINEIRRLINSGAWDGVRAIFAKLNLERWFAIEHADNILEIDTESELSLLMLSDELAPRSFAVFTESPARLGKPKFRSTDQGWHSEMIIPLHAPSTKKPVRLAGLQHLILADQYAMASTPDGADAEGCYYIKIYGGEDYLDTFLVQTLGPLIQAGVAQGIVDKWFFVRYRDPEYHLRLRVFGRRSQLSQFVDGLIERHIRPRVYSHEVANVVTDTYKPEYSRYGGRNVMPSIEELFFFDSAYCLAIREICINDGSDDKIWKAALSGAVQYIADFDLSAEETMQTIEAQRDGFAAEIELDTNQHRQLSILYKKHRDYIEDAVSTKSRVAPAIRKALNGRSHLTRKLLDGLDVGVARGLKLDMLGSVIHMQCNRLFLGAARSQEFVMWDFILRAHRSINAKNK